MNSLISEFKIYKQLLFYFVKLYTFVGSKNCLGLKTRKVFTINTNRNKYGICKKLLIRRTKC